MAKVTKFTADYVKNLKLPPDKIQVDHFQTLTGVKRSLILTLNKSGKKTWSVLFYDHSKPRRKKLGEFTNMKCEKAVAAAISFKVDDQLKKAAAGSFKDVLDNYLARRVNSAKDKFASAKEVDRILRKYVLPHWKKKLIADIDRDVVTALLDHIEDKHSAGVADSALALISALFNWHQARTGAFRSPIVRGMRRQRPIRRTRFLNDEEIRQFWIACEGEGTYGAICRVLLLTGQRKSKVQMMRWADVDLETGVWMIPRQPREKGAPTALTLPLLARELVKMQPRIAGNLYVFAGRGNGVAFNAFSDAKVALDKKLNFAEGWRTHDLRRTCRKLMTRARVLTEVAELALGHSIKGVQAVYDDPDEYRPMIDEALVKVEERVRDIINRVLDGPGYWGQPLTIPRGTARERL